MQNVKCDFYIDLNQELLNSIAKTVLGFLQFSP